MKIYAGMNPNITLLDCIEQYVEKASDYLAYNIVNRINQMKATDYTAAIDLVAELTGKNPNWVAYQLSTESRSYESKIMDIELKRLGIRNHGWR